MDDTPDDGRTAVLQLSPAERERRDVSPADVRDALLEVIAAGDQSAKTFEDRTVPKLALDHRTIESENTRPVVFRNCSFPEGIHAVQADLEVPLRFEDCSIEGFRVDGARFEYDVEMRDTMVGGEFVADEARFERDAEFTGTRFAAPVSIEEASFSDDTNFDGITFEEHVSFQATRFAGSSNDLDDNASFDGATFEAPASFQKAAFEYTRFDEATFADRANFEEASFDGDAVFSEFRFDAEADFDESRFEEDVTFDATTFSGDAIFRGATVEGGARTL